MYSLNECPWLRRLSDEVWDWLEHMQIPGRPGWIRLCRSGALIEPGRRSGLGFSCLALKTCVMLGLVQRVPAPDLTAWISHIQRFQRRWGPLRGRFEDRSILDAVPARQATAEGRAATLRAETRQACATLLTAGARPFRRVSTGIPRTEDQVRAYIAALDWTQPWAAGSHAGHLLFFYGLHARYFNERHADRLLVRTVFQELDRLQDPVTGSWFSKRPSDAQVVNGAMKILTGYAFLKRPFLLSERLIDTCLAIPNAEHGCNNADVIYVLRECTRQTDYRCTEIQAWCRERVEVIRRFRQHDGGFSYAENTAQTNYYGAPVSRGLCESDVHGTALFAWSLVMIGDIMGWNGELGWTTPVT